MANYLPFVLTPARTYAFFYSTSLGNFFNGVRSLFRSGKSWGNETCRGWRPSWIPCRRNSGGFNLALIPKKYQKNFRSTSLCFGVGQMVSDDEYLLILLILANNSSVRKTTAIFWYSQSFTRLVEGYLFFREFYNILEF